MTLQNAFQLMRNNRFYWLTSYQGNYVCTSVTNDFIDSDFNTIRSILKRVQIHLHHICVNNCAAFPRSLQLWNLVLSIYAKTIFVTLSLRYCSDIIKNIFYICMFYIYISYSQLLINYYFRYDISILNR